MMEKKREEKHCPPQFGGQSTPWLVYANGRYMKSHIFCNILEPNRNCIKRIPELRRKYCYGSSHGWFILRINDNCCLWNPLSLETINLPDLIFEDDVDFRVRSCTLSSVPTDPNCMVLFFCVIPLIVYCQPGDTKWTMHSFEMEGGIEHAVGLSNGTIYACTGYKKLMTITRDSSGCLSLRLLNVENPNCPPGINMLWVYVLESRGELFRVYLYFSTYNNAVRYIEVFMFDPSQMAWEKVESLGGEVFFLTYNGRPCASCSANEQAGLEGDCIYFTYPKDNSLYVFDMKDGSISVSLPCPDLRMAWYSPFWFIPMTNNRMVDMTKDNERRTVIDDKKMMVKQSLKEMPKEEEQVDTIILSFLIFRRRCNI